MAPPWIGYQHDLDLGLHTSRSALYRNGSPEDQEIGRRIFWAAYGGFESNEESDAC